MVPVPGIAPSKFFEKPIKIPECGFILPTKFSNLVNFDKKVLYPHEFSHPLIFKCSYLIQFSILYIASGEFGKLSLRSTR